MKDGSRIAVGVLNDSETSQSTGIIARAMTTKFAVPHPIFCRGVVVTAAITGSPVSEVAAWGRRAEAPDEQEGDDRHTDKDQDGDRRPDAQVQRVEQVVVTQDRDRAGVISPAGQDVDVVEDPERVRSEEH